MITTQKNQRQGSPHHQNPSTSKLASDEKSGHPTYDGHTKLKISDLTAMLQLSTSMVYKMVERGEIPHFRIGTAIRFDSEEIREWLKTFHRPTKVATSEMSSTVQNEREEDR